MSVLRIAHLSDTHLGYRALAKADPVSERNQRTVDIEGAFAWAIDDLIERRVDLILHAGDLFHHTRPVYPAIAAAIRQFRKIEKAGIPAYVVAGNHDTPRLRVSGSVFGLLESALPDIHFAGGYEDVQQPIASLDAWITLIPHGRLTNPMPPAVFPVPDLRNILVTHGLPPNMELPFPQHEPGEQEIPEHLLDQKFDYIALGHYHPFGQVRSNAWFCGSTERITWRDEFIGPGYAVATLRGPGETVTVEHIENPNVRPMHSYEIAFAPDQETDGQAIAEMALLWMEALNQPEAMTRIVLKNVPRPVRRHAEALIRLDAGELVWSVEVVSAGAGVSPFLERSTELPSSNLLDQFQSFVSSERDAGRYEASFAEAFAVTGRHELELAQVTVDSQPSAEGAE